MSAPPPPAPPIAAPRSAPVEPPTPPPVVSKPAPENERAPKVASNFEAPPARDGAEALRPVAPAPSVQRKGSPWPWIAAGALVLVVGTVAVAAFLSRQKPADLAITETSQVTPPSPSPTSTGPKIVERVGGTAAQPAPSDTPAPAPAPTVAPSPAPTVAASPTPAASAAPAPAPSQTAAPAPAPSTATLPVSARAAMLVANNGDTAKPVVSLGSVVWTAAAANPGQPGSSGVKAEIDVPELKLHASMVLRKNVDPSLPASHTIDLRVTFDDGATVRGVKDIALPQMRREDPPGVTALAGVRVKINDGYFLIGLNRNDADITRNIDALVNNGWLDFPMLLPDERIAKLTFEKGPDGTRLMNEAVAAWK